MSIFNMIPGLNKIFNCDNNISQFDKDQLLEKISELDVKELKSKLLEGTQGITNSSLFVSGAIPSLLWMMVFIIAFNYIGAPILISLGLNVPILELPKWYSDLCSTVALGLFAKKAWESTDMTVGKFQKKSKYESEAQTDINVEERIAKIEESKCANKEPNKELLPLNPFDINGTGSDTADTNYDDDVEVEEKYDDPEFINKRLDQIVKKIEKK